MDRKRAWGWNMVEMKAASIPYQNGAKGGAIQWHGIRNFALSSHPDQPRQLVGLSNEVTGWTDREPGVGRCPRGKRRASSTSKM